MLEVIATQFSEMLLYFFAGGCLFVVLLAFIVLPALVVLSIVFRRNLLSARCARFLILSTIAFIWGAIFNGLWYGLLNKRLYVMGDPLFHFHPFLPFGWWSLDKAWGGHLEPGVEMWHLRILWLASAIIVWTLAFFTFKTVTRHRLTSHSSGQRPRLA